MSCCTTPTLLNRRPPSPLTPRYTEQAVQFIERSKNSPFFLYVPHTFPHIPLAASPRFRGKSPLGLYGDVIEELDWSVGEVMSALRRNNLDRNTLVMFSSDNGPWYQGSPGRLRGRKGSTYEGGVREPFLARFPGRIPAGLVQKGVSGTIDILPCLARLCSAPAPKLPLDGVDIWPLLTGAATEVQREMLLYFDDWNLQCARWGKWKLHVARYNSYVYGPAPPGGRVNLPLRPELYDIEADPEESYDVAAEHPEVVEQMRARLEKLIAGFPEPVRKAWSDTAARRAAEIPAGALPRAAPK